MFLGRLCKRGIIINLLLQRQESQVNIWYNKCWHMFLSLDSIYKDYAYNMYNVFRFSQCCLSEIMFLFCIKLQGVWCVCAWGLVCLGEGVEGVEGVALGDVARVFLVCLFIVWTLFTFPCKSCLHHQYDQDYDVINIVVFPSPRSPTNNYHKYLIFIHCCPL